MSLDERYEEWMFERFVGHYCSDYIIQMCESGVHWEVFLEEIGE